MASIHKSDGEHVKIKYTAHAMVIYRQFLRYIYISALLCNVHVMITLYWHHRVLHRNFHSFSTSYPFVGIIRSCVTPNVRTIHITVPSLSCQPICSTVNLFINVTCHVLVCHRGSQNRFLSLSHEAPLQLDCTAAPIPHPPPPIPHLTKLPPATHL